MAGPPNKWVKQQISAISDPSAPTSDWVLTQLTGNLPINAALSSVCSDGTFAFVGVYST
jgi:hypothetical protein